MGRVDGAPTGRGVWSRRPACPGRLASLTPFYPLCFVDTDVAGGLAGMRSGNGARHVRRRLFGSGG